MNAPQPGPGPADDPDRFGPGIPLAAVLGASDDEPAPVPAPAASAVPEPPDVATATAANRTDTVAVTATDRGLPVDVHVDPRELRYGGRHLAEAILEMCLVATAEARARRREDLAAAGVDADLLDTLLPTGDALAHARADRASAAPAPVTWMRPV
ncbi:hypothetical protein GCM10023094_22270 [Rhodococcus olei]|uniref:YbaB/EbfC DNA-binding family protein n=1 Tax=Rhodococcus olei TaxID=2161675 RepID=A0ABP8P2C8_9NOCA